MSRKTAIETLPSNEERVKCKECFHISVLRSGEWISQCCGQKVLIRSILPSGYSYSIKCCEPAIRTLCSYEDGYFTCDLCSKAHSKDDAYRNQDLLIVNLKVEIRHQEDKYFWLYQAQRRTIKEKERMHEKLEEKEKVITSLEEQMAKMREVINAVKFNDVWEWTKESFMKDMRNENGKLTVDLANEREKNHQLNIDLIQKTDTIKKMEMIEAENGNLKERIIELEKVNQAKNALSIQLNEPEQEDQLKDDKITKLETRLNALEGKKEAETAEDMSAQLKLAKEENARLEMINQRNEELIKFFQEQQKIMSTTMLQMTSLNRGNMMNEKTDEEEMAVEQTTS